MAAAALLACSGLVLATPPGAFDPRSSTGYSLSAAAAELDGIFKVSKDKALPHPGEVPPTPGKVCGQFWTCCSCQKLVHGATPGSGDLSKPGEGAPVCLPGVHDCKYSSVKGWREAPKGCEPCSEKDVTGSPLGFSLYPQVPPTIQARNVPPKPMTDADETTSAEV